MPPPRHAVGEFYPDELNVQEAAYYVAQLVSDVEELQEVRRGMRELEDLSYTDNQTDYGEVSIAE
jgi:hypothetical protein